jgi:hypothetical protein
MKLWMDIMRDVEQLIYGYPRYYDAWEAGGVNGLVIGPFEFNTSKFLPGIKREAGVTPTATFDPDPAIYARLGVTAPPAARAEPELRKGLEKALRAAKDRGWSVYIFQASAGAGPGGSGPTLTDPLTRAATIARMVDTLSHYPMVDGAIMDGPEWGYEIAPHHQNHRSYIFHDLPATVAPKCAELGYDYDALVKGKDRLFETLHDLNATKIGLYRDGGLLGAYNLLGADPNLMAWLSFRVDSLTDFFSSVRSGIDAELGRPFKLGVGPRSAAFAPLCGYDFHRLAAFMDILLPKHYFFHRGFDGMVGTVHRYVETLCAWNPGLRDEDALAVVELLFGLSFPGVTSRQDMEEALTPEFFQKIVTQETKRALAAVDDPARIVPWVDAGRNPHDGDPMPPGQLRQLLQAAEQAGLQHFLYHHHGNLTPGEWSVMSEICGTPWNPLESDYLPLDEMVL